MGLSLRARARWSHVPAGPTERRGRATPVPFYKSVPSNLGYFISGACSAFSFGAMAFEPPVKRDAEGPWAAVGVFIAQAMNETVATHGSLPPLPDDLYSVPECDVLWEYPVAPHEPSPPLVAD